MVVGKTLSVVFVPSHPKTATMAVSTKAFSNSVTKAVVALAVLSTEYPTAKKIGAVKLSSGDPTVNSSSIEHNESPSETGGSEVVVSVGGSGSTAGETGAVVGMDVIDGPTDNVGKSEGPTEGDKDGPSDGKAEISSVGLFGATGENVTMDGDGVEGDDEEGSPGVADGRLMGAIEGTGFGLMEGEFEPVGTDEVGITGTGGGVGGVTGGEGPGDGM